MRKVWKLMPIFAVLALAWIACVPMGSTALPDHEMWTTYYSGPDFQTDVGLRVWPACLGGSYGYGRVTPYKSVQSVTCDPNPIPSDPYCYIYNQNVPCPF